MASTVWRGYISFGLISIPVRLFRAARAERISFRRMVRSTPASSGRRTGRDEEDDEPDVPEERTGIALARPRSAAPAESVAAPAPRTAASVAPAPVLQPLRQIAVREESEQKVAPQEIVKGFEFEPDRYVAIEPEELKSLAPQTATEMAIEEFVSLSEIDPVFFETSYYVVPEQAGQKAYALLYRAMADTQLVALAQFAMHNREHVIVIRPAMRGLIAHTMFYLNEVRADEEYRAETAVVSDKELKLARTLIESLTSPFEPQKYKDTYREKLEALIAKKVAGEPVAAPTPVKTSATVIDIADALQRSLAALKKPPAFEPPKAEVPAAPKKRSKASARS